MDLAVTYVIHTKYVFKASHVFYIMTNMRNVTVINVPFGLKMLIYVPVIITLKYYTTIVQQAQEVII